MPGWSCSTQQASRASTPRPSRVHPENGGSEHALTAALSAIDAIYGIEADHAANQDVAAPVEVQQFWDDHGQLPGFAVGS